MEELVFRNLPVPPYIYFISNFNELQQVTFDKWLFCSTLYGLEDKVMEYDYKEKIIEMVGKTEDVKFLALIYGLISESIKIREEEKASQI